MAGHGGESILISAECPGDVLRSGLNHRASRKLIGVDAIKCSEHSMQPASRGVGSPHGFVEL